MRPGLHEHAVFAGDILDGLHLLEADAGTGKTWTIAGLVVRALIERALGIEQLLVVTFTNAATAELGARIRQRIAQLERLLDDRLQGRSTTIDEAFCVAYAERLDDEAAHAARALLRVALACADEMAVHTIHGFCQRVIGEHALSIGVPPGLPVGADDGQRAARVVADWWRAQAVDATPARLQSFALAGLTPAALGGAFRSIAAQPLALVAPAPAPWQELEDALEYARRDLAEALAAEGKALLDWLAVKGNADGRRFRPDWTRNWIDALAAFCADASGVAAPEALHKLASQRFGERLPPPSLRAIPSACERLVALLSSIERLPAWIAQELVAGQDARRRDALPQLRALDFDDLLRLVHDALADAASGPALAQALRQRYPVVLIDECQDTDALQWAIFRRIYLAPPGDDAQRIALHAGTALVLVGDPKQAIYAFRGADVYSYLDARETVRKLHRLGENQRSSRALIASVNAVFARERPFLIEEIGFAPAAFGARTRRVLVIGDEGSRSPMTLVRLEPDAHEECLTAAGAARQAVRASVAEIGRLLRAGARLGQRALRASDIAVLVDNHRQGAAIKRALAGAGIGAAEISRDSVLGTLECAEAMRVIAAIDAPAEPGLLRSALATTLLGADAQSLATLDEDPARGLHLAERFARARADWERYGPVAALRRLFREEEVGARLAAVRDGERRLTNLMHLVELLGADEHARRGPGQALRVLARRRSGGADRDSEELRLESDEGLVRILTVHKSKGLEFPIVFLPFTWAGRAHRKATPSVLHRRADAERWQAVLDFVPDEDALRQAAREGYAEALRGMYVALTRAEQRCYLFWGAVAGAQFAPLAWLLDGLDPLQQRAWRPGSRSAPPLTPDLVERSLLAWRERAAAHEPGAASVLASSLLMADERSQEQRGDSSTGHAREPETSAPQSPELSARPWRATIPAAAITTSFSAIASALADEDAAGGLRARELAERPDHDQQPSADDAALDESAGETASAAEAAAPDSIRFRFPAGAEAGVCLHGILEDLRFDARPERDVLADRLSRSGYRHLDPEQVSQWLQAVIAAPLHAPQGETIQLTQVAPARQVREMDFLLSGQQVSERALIEAVRSEFELDLSAGSARWHGYLRGFIDLVFEHDGRYYLLDWKSNHLGDSPRHYDRRALAAAMRTHAYALQACLYSLALHRWLRARLAGYDYQRHVGGAFYVFLRGAGLALPGANDLGVHASRPSAALVDTLDRLFGPAPAGAAR